MAEASVEVKMSPEIARQLDELRNRVERAARIAGVAAAVADELRATVGGITPAGRLGDLLADMAARLDTACDRANQHMAPMSHAQPGDVVQVDPRGDELGYGATFAIVERVLDGYVLAYVPGAEGGDAYVRLGPEQCVKVGVAEWTHDPSARCVDGRMVADAIAEEEARVAVWKAALDEGTCAACHVMDGKAVASVGAPPHPDCTNPQGCRCVIVGLDRG